MRIKYVFLSLLILIIVIPLVNALWFGPIAPPPTIGSVGPPGPPGPPGNLTGGDGVFVHIVGDNMTGSLNMSNNNIWGINNLQAHNATFNGNVLPNINYSYDLGAFDKVWKNLYVGNLILYNTSSLGNITGPQGPQGLTGPTGPQGPIGPQGPPGTGNSSGNGSISFASFLTKEYIGADLTGSDGETGRMIDTGMAVNIVNVDNFILQPTWDYTESGTILIFSNNIWDNQIITVYGNVPFIPNNYLGSAFTGLDGEQGRNLSITATNVMVIVDNFMLQDNVDYTLNTNTITILNNLWNDQKITIWVIA